MKNQDEIQKQIIDESESGARMLCLVVFGIPVATIIITAVIRWFFKI